MKIRNNRILLTIISVLIFQYLIIPFFLLKNQNYLFSDVSRVDAYEEWESRGIEWYYDNLDDIDRKKIRQAMDYAIDRQILINSLMGGYAVPIATEIGQNINGYDKEIQPREYNLSKARQLLTEVFGKTYDPEKAINDSKHYTNIPYFHMTLVTSTNSYLRNSLPIISKGFQDIGIEIGTKVWNEDIILQRLFLDPIAPGYDYPHGGFDALIGDFRTFPDPDFTNEFFNESFAPLGENFQWIERQDAMQIINRSLLETTNEDRMQAIKDFQEWFYEWVPKSIFFQKKNIFVQNINMTGLDLFNYARHPWVHNISIKGKTSNYIINTTIPVGFENFNPILTRNWFSAVITSNIYLSLAQRRGVYNLTHAIPVLAEHWTSSVDGLMWNVTLRQGVKFHDGSEVDADDVVFSYRAAMDCPSSTWRATMRQWFNNITDIKKINNYTVEFHLKEFYPYVTTQIFTIPILSKDQMEPIPIDTWNTDDTNTGKLPILGCGPYKFNSFVNSPWKVICVKSDYWNASIMGHNPALLGGGIWWDYSKAPNEFHVTLSSVPDLQNPFDLMDPNTYIISSIETLNSSSKVKLDIILGYEWQGVVYNQYDTRWGLNPHDPYVLYNYPRPPPNFIGDPSFILGFTTFFLLGFIFILFITVRFAFQYYKEVTLPKE